MTTKHPRLNITLAPEQAGLLALLAEREQKSVSAAARDLIATALELQEDLHFSRLAVKRDTDDTVWVDHKDVWK